MSCVAAVVEDGKVYLAADSFLGSAQQVVPTSREVGKIFRHPSGALMGVAGTIVSRRARTFDLPPRAKGQDLADYVMDEVAWHFWKHVGGPSEQAELLLGIEGRLFHSYSNHVTLEPPDAFSAIGSGSAVALGSLATPTSDKPAVRVRRAVAIAERFTPTVRGPIEALAGVGRTKIPEFVPFDLP